MCRDGETGDGKSSGNDGSVRLCLDPDKKGVLVNRASVGAKNCHGQINTHYGGHDPDAYMYENQSFR